MDGSTVPQAPEKDNCEMHFRSTVCRHSCAATAFSPATSANSTKMTQLLVSDTDTPMAMPTSGPSEKGIWMNKPGVMFQALKHVRP